MVTGLVRGHEKVPGYGHLRSPLVATKVPAFGHEKSPPLTEASTREVTWPVTVAVQPSTRTRPRDISMQAVRKHRDMHAAYREVGSYRAAAEICGTTPKTVKRSIDAARRAESGNSPDEVRHNYDGVAELVAETVARTKGRITAKR